jgi:hypothetical protein
MYFQSNRYIDGKTLANDPPHFALSNAVPASALDTDLDERSFTSKMIPESFAARLASPFPACSARKLPLAI